MGNGFSKSGDNQRLNALYHLVERWEELAPEDLSPALAYLAEERHRYIQATLIGCGASKKVFSVHDTLTRRLVAMAVPATLPLVSEEAFFHEARVAALLDHPNIIKIHDIGNDPTLGPYYTMSLKRGRSLEDLLALLREGEPETLERYNLSARLAIFSKVCDAIAHAHSSQILHLDLKPSNIQIGLFGEVLVCGWGQACDSGADSTPVSPPQARLSPEEISPYHAPEIVRHWEPNDECADIHALGGILHAILTFSVPVAGRAAASSSRSRSPLRPVPAGLRAIVSRAMEPDPARRTPTVNALRADLQRFQLGFPTEAENAGVLKQMMLFYIRNRNFCLTIFLTLLFCGSLLAWAIDRMSIQEQAALQSLKETEWALALHEASFGELHDLGLRHSSVVVRMAEQHQLAGEFNAAETLLDQALKAEPDQSAFHRAKGTLLFVKQRFNDAIPFLESGQIGNEEIVRQARQLAAIHGNARPLPVPEMLETMSALKTKTKLLLHMTLFDLSLRSDPAEKAVIVETYLRAVYPEWTGPFDYSPADATLRISGNGLQKLSINPSPLEALNLRVLDLSGSDLRHLGNRGLQGIEVLDISDTPLTELPTLGGFVRLRELRVSPGQLNEEQRAKLPKGIRVVERLKDQPDRLDR